MTEARTIWCCACLRDVPARLTTGAEIYPHRADLVAVPRWICDGCKNSVGCHDKTADRTRPLGCIPNKEMAQARRRIHAIMDPLWQSKTFTRPAVYERLSRTLGRPFHTGELRTSAEARAIHSDLLSIQRDIQAGKVRL